jgi:hypothetical protein
MLAPNPLVPLTQVTLVPPGHSARVGAAVLLLPRLGTHKKSIEDCTWVLS